MPALPWVQRQAVEPERRYLAMASRLPLKAYRSVPGFMRDTLRIRRQLARSEGLVGYGLNAQLARKTFWTFSVWDDRARLASFAAADPHDGSSSGCGRACARPASSSSSSSAGRSRRRGTT